MSELSPRGRRLSAILWPAFVMAGVLEALVFVVIEPQGLAWFGTADVQASPATIHSVAFFVFWAVISVAGLMSEYLRSPPPALPWVGAAHRAREQQRSRAQARRIRAGKSPN